MACEVYVRSVRLYCNNTNHKNLRATFSTCNYTGDELITQTQQSCWWNQAAVISNYHLLINICLLVSLIYKHSCKHTQPWTRVCSLKETIRVFYIRSIETNHEFSYRGNRALRRYMQKVLIHSSTISTFANIHCPLLPLNVCKQTRNRKSPELSRNLRVGSFRVTGATACKGNLKRQ